LPRLTPTCRSVPPVTPFPSPPMWSSVQEMLQPTLLAMLDELSSCFHPHGFSFLCKSNEASHSLDPHRGTGRTGFPHPLFSFLIFSDKSDVGSPPFSPFFMSCAVWKPGGLFPLFLGEITWEDSTMLHWSLLLSVPLFSCFYPRGLVFAASQTHRTTLFLQRPLCLIFFLPTLKKFPFPLVLSFLIPLLCPPPNGLGEVVFALSINAGVYCPAPRFALSADVRLFRPISLRLHTVVSIISLVLTLFMSSLPGFVLFLLFPASGQRGPDFAFLFFPPLCLFPFLIFFPFHISTPPPFLAHPLTC